MTVDPPSEGMRKLSQLLLTDCSCPKGRPCLPDCSVEAAIIKMFAEEYGAGPRPKEIDELIAMRARMRETVGLLSTCRTCGEQVKEHRVEYYTYLICGCEQDRRRCNRCNAEVKSGGSCVCVHPKKIDPNTLTWCCNARREPLMIGNRVYMLKCTACGSRSPGVYCAGCRQRTFEGHCHTVNCPVDQVSVFQPDEDPEVGRSKMKLLLTELNSYLGPIPRERVPADIAWDIQEIMSAFGGP